MTGPETETKNRRRPPKAVLPVLLWDTAWKVVAIWRAVQLKKYRWIPVLAATSTVGVLPIVFLLKNRESNPPPP
ncbi:MAG: DUF5652 family protein [bacterium]